ncbi:MAG: DUF6088 family protein [Pontiellaceae bacterium]|jgi:hypothetical protein|nr:DUF6088 family protein [Pontiellaceae bacterium]
MKTTDTIASSINRFAKGYVFTASSFKGEVKSLDAARKALSRMADSGKIVRLSKGRFYKPESSPFGVLPPGPDEVVKDLLESRGRMTGYLTGLSVYNTLKLSTQVGRVIQIGRNEVRPSLRRGVYRIVFLKQKNRITPENIPLLQLLDCIRTVKKIPGTSMEDACVRLRALVAERTEDDRRILVRLAMKYPPSTRALLGALLGEPAGGERSVRLMESLNPLTTYCFPGAGRVLKDADVWRIRV